HAPRVRRAIALDRGDFDLVAFGGLDGDRPARVADPHPLLGSDLGPIGPGPTRYPGTGVGAGVEFIAQVAQRHGQAVGDSPPHVRRSYGTSTGPPRRIAPSGGSESEPGRLRGCRRETIPR